MGLTIDHILRRGSGLAGERPPDRPNATPAAGRTGIFDASPLPPE
jgi:hypothetical protein